MQNAMTKAIALKDRQLEEQRQEHARTVQQMLADHKNQMDQTNAAHNKVVDDLNTREKNLRISLNLKITSIQKDMENMRMAKDQEINLLQAALGEANRTILQRDTTIVELRAEVKCRDDLIVQVTAHRAHL